MAPRNTQQAYKSPLFSFCSESSISRKISSADYKPVYSGKAYKYLKIWNKTCDLFSPVFSFVITAFQVIELAWPHQTPTLDSRSHQRQLARATGRRNFHSLSLLSPTFLSPFLLPVYHLLSSLSLSPSLLSPTLLSLPLSFSFITNFPLSPSFLPLYHSDLLISQYPSLPPIRLAARGIVDAANTQKRRK